jgi:hypothetical protein
MQTQSPPIWMAAEPGLRELRREAARVWQRARRRPAVLALGTFVLAAAAAGFAARRAPVSEAVAVLRVTEVSSPDGRRLDWGKGRLRGFLWEQALSSSMLAQMVRRAGLVPPGGDPSGWVADLVEFTDIEVVQNETIALLPPEDRPRAAYVSIVRHAANPDDALAMVKMIAEHVIRVGGQERTADLALELARIQVAVKAVTTELHALRAEAATPGATAPDQAAVYQVQLKHESIAAAEARLARLARDEAAARLRLGAEESGLTAEFDLLSTRVHRPKLGRGERAVVAGTVGLGLGLGLCILLVGAFDPRVSTLEDVRRLGLNPLGHVRAPGRGDSATLPAPPERVP